MIKRLWREPAGVRIVRVLRGQRELVSIKVDKRIAKMFFRWA